MEHHKQDEINRLLTEAANREAEKEAELLKTSEKNDQQNKLIKELQE